MDNCAVDIAQIGNQIGGHFQLGTQLGNDFCGETPALRLTCLVSKFKLGTLTVVINV